MLDRSELSFNEEFVKMFEEWVSIVYPDDHWRLDKHLTEDCWEYKHGHTEDDFILWLNVFVFSNCYKDTWGACRVEYVGWKNIGVNIK